MVDVYGYSPGMILLPTIQELNSLRLAYLKRVERSILWEEMQACCDLLSETECLDE